MIRKVKDPNIVRAHLNVQELMAGYDEVAEVVKAEECEPSLASRIVRAVAIPTLVVVAACLIAFGVVRALS